MNEEKYYDKEDSYTDEQIEMIEFGEECGLSFQKEFSDSGLPVFIGNNREWDAYNNGGKY